MNQLNGNLSTIDGICLHHLFELQVLETPNAIAAAFKGNSITYQQLNVRANQMAHYLTAQGALSSSLIGLCLERSIEMLVALIAILKAGATYVPLDPKYPQKRLQYMVDDSQLKWIITQKSCEARFTESVRTLCVDDEIIINKLNTSEEHNPSIIHLTAEVLSHVIYTSGSTGKPKGVCIRHRNSVALMNWVQKSFSTEERSKTLFSTSLCFDLSIVEIWAPLICGGQVILVDNILELINGKVHPTLINTVPSVMEALLTNDYQFNNVLVVNLAGEPLKKSLVNRVFKNSNIKSLNNLYGPSEDTTYSTCKRYYGATDAAVTIGDAIDNTLLYVMDEEGKELADGDVGELYIEGSGVSLGYLGKPELTSMKFIQSPHTKNATMYRTGDLVRKLTNGEFEYIGRTDHQVKIRGFRIELGEIETQLELCFGVLEAIVLAISDGSESQYIAAYVKIENSMKEDFQLSLKNQLEKCLPDYMLPSTYIAVDRWPLTLNGKIDRDMLSQTESAREKGGVYVAPSNQLQVKLCNIWQKVLSRNIVGIEDNFFAMGGHSLLITRLSHEIYRELDKMISVDELFNFPTVRSLSEFIENVYVKKDCNQQISQLGLNNKEEEREVLEL
jgi:amino acid adenylation domain-containing protein